MSLEIRYLGILAETAGNQKETMAYFATVGKLKRAIISNHPGLKEFSFVIAINGRVEHRDAKLNHGDRVSLIPPMPGG